MKNCPPGVKCGGSWTKRMMLTKSSGGGGEPSPGYGLLYNWYAATDVRGIAPSGFRVPNVADYDEFLLLDSSVLKSSNLVSEGQPGWVDIYAGTNSSGFNAFPSAERESNGSYNPLFGEIFSCWAADFENFAQEYFTIARNFASSISNNRPPQVGASIRCISDTEPLSATATDADGNVYTWVQIGSQYWLQQSLKTTRYNNGDLIPTGLDNAAWAATTDGAWAYPNGDSNLPI